jgi:CheY-like chemotaxis protein
VRIIIVDDQLSQRAGRVAILSGVSGVEVTGMTFEEAAALGPGWRDVDIAVLDGHDRRPAQRRAEAAAAAGVAGFPVYDNYVGVRVAAVIREYSGPEQTRIIMISAHARDNDLRARRIAQAGVDYVFEHYEAEPDPQTFVRAVLHPETFSPHPANVDWVAAGYTRAPDVARAIDALESSAAGPMLLADEPGVSHPEHAWSLRRLREQIDRALHLRVLPGGGPRTRRASRKSQLAERMRQALGRDLPVDPK